MSYWWELETEYAKLDEEYRKLDEEYSKFKNIFLNKDKNIEYLIKNRWYDNYLLMLAIYDHITECGLLYQKYKLSNLSKTPKEKLKYELDKELMDLFILLEMYSKNKTTIYLERIERFKEKIERSG